MTGQELKEFMQERGLNYRSLGELIGYSEAAVRRAISNEPSEPMAHAVKMAEQIEKLSKKAAIVDGLAEAMAQNLAENAQDIK